MSPASTAQTRQSWDHAPANRPRYANAQVYGNRHSWSFKARQRRFAHVRRLVDGIVAKHGRCRIADLGGTAAYWDITPELIARPEVSVTLVNLDAAAGEGFGAGRIALIKADACACDDLSDNSFDLVHSNSVIEHVGDWRRMQAFAKTVRRLAPRYYVQTPYYWFPIEPHFRVPFFQMLPEPIQVRALLWFSLGFGGRRETVSDAVMGAQSAHLLDRMQFAALFPDAKIIPERFGPLTKSLMAVRD